MKHGFSRILLVMLVTLLAMSAVMPAAMAANVPIVSNATNTMVMFVGMKDTLYVTTSGVKQSASDFSWKSSNSKVVSVNKYGAIVAKKIGTATIYATRKSNGDRLSMKVTVKRNKVDNIKTRPSASATSYKSVGTRLKSVEVVSPSKIAVEYYLCCNFPSNWKLTRIKSLQDAINLYDRSTGKYKMTIVGDDYQIWAKSVSGFKPRSGQFVQVIKATYTGNRIFTDVDLSAYLIDNSGHVQIDCDYSDR